VHADSALRSQIEGLDLLSISLSPSRLPPLLIVPRQQGTGLPFNRYSWLTTHNSFAKLGQKSRTGTPVLTLENQQDSITDQLNVRTKTLTPSSSFSTNLSFYLRLTRRRIVADGSPLTRLTHRVQPAIDVLKEIQVFLEANPSEVVTIIIEDYVTSPMGLTKVFNASGLSKYWFPVSRMPKNGEDWPLLSDMISRNQRLLVFTSKSAKQASEGIAYEWTYIVENQCEEKALSYCFKQASSSPAETSTCLMLLQMETEAWRQARARTERSRRP
ncbi:hypothetical protein B296_00053674, partial [Ensete ventricosum]